MTTRETYTITTEETTAIISQSSIDAVRRKTIAATGVRLYRDGAIGVAGGMGAVSAGDLTSRAEATLERGVPYEAGPTEDTQRLVRDNPTKLPPHNGFVAEIDRILVHLRSTHPQFVFSNVARRVTTTATLRNDRGLDLSDTGYLADVAIIFKAKASTGILDGEVAVEQRHFDPDAFIDYADRQLEAFQTPAQLPTGPVVVAFASTDILPFMKLARDLHGLSFASGGSSLSGKGGRRLFSQRFTLYQSRQREDTNAPFFDAEGTTNIDDRFALVEQGVVAAAYTDKKNAARFSLPLTGAATGEYDDVPSLGFPGFTVAPTDQTAAELIDGRPTILVAIASGGDFTPAGDFGTPVQLGYLYDGERLLGRLPEFALRGNLYEMFGDRFVGVSSDTLHPADRSRAVLMEMDVA